MWNLEIVGKIPEFWDFSVPEKKDHQYITFDILKIEKKQSKHLHCRLQPTIGIKGLGQLTMAVILPMAMNNIL